MNTENCMMNTESTGFRLVYPGITNPWFLSFHLKPLICST